MERSNLDTPAIITEWLENPYIFFSKMFNHCKTVLDCACGEGRQHRLVEHYIPWVTGIDKLAFKDNIVPWDLNKPLPCLDNFFDVVFSFETIEHLPREKHVDFIKELLRVSKSYVVLGSVSLDGPDFLNGVEIWKRDKNPYHVYEYNINEFMRLCNVVGPYTSRQSYYTNVLEDQKVKMTYGLTPNGISNYVLMRKI